MLGRRRGARWSLPAPGGLRICVPLSRGAVCAVPCVPCIRCALCARAAARLVGPLPPLPRAYASRRRRRWASTAAPRRRAVSTATATVGTSALGAGTSAWAGAALARGRGLAHGLLLRCPCPARIVIQVQPRVEICSTCAAASDFFRHFHSSASVQNRSARARSDEQRAVVACCAFAAHLCPLHGSRGHGCDGLREGSTTSYLYDVEPIGPRQGADGGGKGGTPGGGWR